jgi:predicted lipoprotein with Yx(FWY)xxD motif
MKPLRSVRMFGVAAALGAILVDARGRTLYLFEKDRNGRAANGKNVEPAAPAAPSAGGGYR